MLKFTKKVLNIKKVNIYLLHQKNIINLYLFNMKKLEKFIDYISTLLYGTQKNITFKHF